MNATTHGARHAPSAVPASLRRSRLLSRGGFDVFAGMLDERFREQLLAEALERNVEALECDIPDSDGEEVRGGRPARRFLHATGGPVQDAFYRAPWVLDFLRRLTAPTLVPTGERGTYSYYTRAGDFLAIHRDIQTCDLAVITCLRDGAEVEGDGGSLCLYPERLEEPLGRPRDARRGRAQAAPRRGQTIALCGGLVPHALLPVAEGQERIVSVLCYHIP